MIDAAPAMKLAASAVARLVRCGEQEQGDDGADRAESGVPVRAKSRLQPVERESGEAIEPRPTAAISWP